MGSYKDEHRSLTYGEIFKGDAGLAALKYLIQYCTNKKHKILMILETHGAGSSNPEKTSKYSENSTYKSEIALIKSLI